MINYFKKIIIQIKKRNLPVSESSFLSKPIENILFRPRTNAEVNAEDEDEPTFDKSSRRPNELK